MRPKINKSIGGAHVEGVLEKMKEQIKSCLLQQDDTGELIPAWMEPLDGYIFA